MSIAPLNARRAERFTITGTVNPRSILVHHVQQKVRDSAAQVLTSFALTRLAGQLASLAEQRTTVYCCVPQLLFDAQELIVLSHAIATGSRSRLDLASRQSNRQISDGGVFRLTAAMAGDRSVTIAARKLNCADRLRQAADLVHFDQDTVGNTLIDTALQSVYIGNEQVVTDKLHFVADALGE